MFVRGLVLPLIITRRILRLGVADTRWLYVALLLVVGLSGCGKGGRDRAQRDIKQTGKGFTVDDFVRAAAEGDSGLTEAYLRGGMDRNSQDARGISPLMAAAVAGKADVVKMLLDENANPNLQDKGGNTALILATENNQPATVRALIEGNADVRIHNRENSTALLKAANSKFDDVAAVLLDTSKDQLAKDGELDKALCVAALLDDGKLLTTLLDKGAKPNAKLENGQTALMFAASFGKEDIVEALLNRGADPRLVDKTGSNASVLALQKGHPDIAKMLDSRVQGGAVQVAAVTTSSPAPSAGTPAPALAAGSPGPGSTPPISPADAASVERERAWLKQNGVEPTALLKKDTGQDDDGDGFTNDEELAAGTDPNDPKSHPPYYTKLRLQRVEGERFPVTFDNLNTKTEHATVTVHGAGEERHMELAPGERVPGEPYKVLKVRARHGYVKDTGEPEDRSELTLINTDNNQRTVLVRGMDANSPNAIAHLVFALDGTQIPVKLGQEFTVPRDPNTRLQVIDIRPTQVVLKLVGSGQTVTLDKE